MALYEAWARNCSRERLRATARPIWPCWNLGGDLIEPISPIKEGTPLAKFIEERGEGLHHVAFDVKNIEGVMADMKAQGFELIDEKSRPGFGGHLIAFIQPKSTMGTLWELVEDV